MGDWTEFFSFFLLFLLTDIKAREQKKEEMKSRGRRSEGRDFSLKQM